MPGASCGTLIGHTRTLLSFPSSATVTLPMAAAGAIMCHKFTAKSTNDIKGVVLLITSSTTPGSLRISIEAIDPATGQPPTTFTPYDANASMLLTTSSSFCGTVGQDLTVGTKTYTFASLPTTGLIVGSEYAIVVESISVSTLITFANTLSLQNALNMIPAASFTGTRASYAITAGPGTFSIPIDESDTWLIKQSFPFKTTFNNNTIYGNYLIAATFTLEAGVMASGVVINLFRNGTPTSPLRMRLVNSSNTVLYDTTIGVTSYSLALLASSSRALYIHFPNTISMPSGTYRVVFSSAGEPASTNALSFRSAIPIDVTRCVNTSMPMISTATTTADALPLWSSWTDPQTDCAFLWLEVDSFIASGGGSGGVSRGRML